MAESDGELMNRIVGLAGQKIRDVLAAMVEQAPSFTTNMNGVDLVIEAGTTQEQAVQAYVEAYRKRWNDPTFELGA